MREKITLIMNLLDIPSNIKSAHHLAIIHLDENENDMQSYLFNGLRSQNIGVQVHYTPVHLQPYYRNYGFNDGHCVKAEKFAKNIISLPIFPGITEEDLDRVCNTILLLIKSRDI